MSQTCSFRCTSQKDYQTILKWRQANPQTVSNYNARYYAANKERIRKQRKQRYHDQQQQNNRQEII
jgi:hypothetical protein